MRTRRTLGAAGLVLGAATVGAWSQAPVWWDGHPGWAVQYAFVGVAFAVTAALLFHQEGQRANAWLLTLLTTLWTVNQTDHRDLGPLAAPAFLAGSFIMVTAIAVLLRYPGRAFDRAGRILVQASGATSALFGIALLLTGRPEWARSHPHGWWPNVWEDQQRFDTVSQARSWWASGLAVVALLLIMRRWMRFGSLERRVLAPLVAASGIVVVMFVIEAAQLTDSPVSARTTAAVSVSTAFVLSALLLRMSCMRVADLVPRLTSAVMTLESVETALRDTLGDPRLDVLYWVEDQQAYVDRSGGLRDLPRPPAPQMVVHARSAAGAPVAAVVADGTLTRHRSLVEAAVAVSGLALENAGLQAALRAQLAAVAEARTRLVTAGLEERRQLERDLHDGAQQRLLGVGMRLGAIRAGTPDQGTADAVDAARAELRLALDELRDLARGIYPAVLTQAGLGPAAENVAERLPVQVHLSIPERRWRPDVESTAYFVLCEALTNAAKHAPDSCVEARAREEAGDLVIDVRDDGPGDPRLNSSRSLPGVRDRVAALGGRVTVTSTQDGGTRLLVRLPCA